jgi:hypothetical protein
MSLRKNKKGVEALPLKYIIIALVAALVVGIALQFTGTLKGGILSTGEKLNETLATQTACELDFEEPVITVDWENVICYETNNTITIEADITDDCGISGVSFELDGDNEWAKLELTSGDEQDGTWSVTDLDWDDYGNGFSSPTEIRIHAYDESPNKNDGWETNASLYCE